MREKRKKSLQCSYLVGDLCDTCDGVSCVRVCRVGSVGRRRCDNQEKENEEATDESEAKE